MIDRREFLAATGAVLALRGLARAQGEPIIDIHQHVGYSGRPDEVLLAHQRAMGITTTILLPAGRPATRPSTHQGGSNGLQAQALGQDACFAFALAHPGEFLVGANDVPDLEGALVEIERQLKRGAVVIAEQKFGVACDAPEMQAIYRLAEQYRVPVLMHWQFGMYNHGFERFHTMLEKYPRVNFIGHAQTWWANIDARHADQTVLYPKGPVTPGGITDRYLRDYPNMYGDLSAGSGLNALTRDEAFTRDFLVRHQDKLLYGSDCNDHVGSGEKCQGAQTIAAVRRLAGSKAVERKLLHDNAKRLFRI
ncbi:amidohydrolase family protein [Luteitalea sp. TBR-22]|uniref:amidohydrolase family protein n=1 Tax=Luteitalea sp. TBR-22 TaxID=2802971 RepID=UPI001EF528B8|nr:amidohydrolase family protein [Luteitalea sp. TBR-22]